MSDNKAFSTHGIVKMAILSALAFVIMYLEIQIPLFPAFLKMDLSDLPALLGSFALGPVAGIIIQLIKNIMHFIFKNDGTGGIGNLANFIVGIAFVVPAGWIYIKNKSKKNAVLAMSVGLVSMVVIGAVANYFILIPAYSKFMPLEAIFEMAKAANPAVSDMKTYITLVVVPFNFLKALLVSVVTLLIYKPMSTLLHK